MTLEAFKSLLRPIVERIQARPLDKQLEADLNDTFAATGEWFKDITEACEQAIQAGWMCKYEAGGVRYGRVIKPDPALHGFSVDVVDMNDVKGPHHRHPNGEIDLIMPQSSDALFDGHGAGWLVYEAGSAHYPTVSRGRALVLYLLPGGAIEFSR
jgi:hypothetical protein